jgi:hypothetical protein
MKNLHMLRRRVGSGAAILTLIASALTWVAPSASAAGPVIRYVATVANGGNDGTLDSPNDCTDPTNPCASIAQAANYDVEWATGQATIVKVAPGTYDEHVASGDFQHSNLGICESVEIDGGVDFQHVGAGTTIVTGDSGFPTIEAPSFECPPGSPSAPIVTLNNLDISGNASADGVLASFGSTVAITDSDIHGNGGDGVNVDYQGQATITNTTINGNSGSGVSVNRQVPNGTEPNVTVTGSTISHNSIGGVVVESGVVVINTSTIAENAGRGVYATGNSAVVGAIDSTVAGTTTTGAGSGGIVETSGASIQVNGTIVADQVGVPDCDGTITDLGYNLSGDSTCGFSGATDLQDVDPQLGALTNYGGPTLTMTLGDSSPALDKISSGSSTCVADFPTDQRGFARPAGSACDIGAVEVQPPAPPVSPPPAPPAPPASTPEVCPPLAIDTKVLPDGTVGKPYSVPLKAHGGCDDAYTWAVPGGAPDGGFPKAGSQITVPAGPWQQAGKTADQADATEPGTTTDITATGASNAAGAGRTVNTAPPGLTVTPGGVLRGTPTKAGTFTFTVSVDDPVLATLVLVVHAPAAVTTSPAPSSPATTAVAPSHDVHVAGRSNTASDNPTAGPGGSLASTGAPVGRLLRFASWLLAIGAALMLAGTRRARVHRRRPVSR